MIDQLIEIEGNEYEIADKKDMFMITLKSSFVGYLTKDGEYLGKTLSKHVVAEIKKVLC
jgi:hypothetical protein